jgi:hypothetical protein
LSAALTISNNLQQPATTLQQPLNNIQTKTMTSKQANYIVLLAEGLQCVCICGGPGRIYCTTKHSAHKDIGIYNFFLLFIIFCNNTLYMSYLLKPIGGMRGTTTINNHQQPLCMNNTFINNCTTTINNFCLRDTPLAGKLLTGC